MSILQVQKLAHRAGTPQKAHRYREKQEGLTVLSPQLKFKGLKVFCSACISKVSLIRVATCHRSLLFVCQVWGGCVCICARFNYMHKEQQMLYRTYTTFLWEKKYLLLQKREEVVQKSPFRQSEIISKHQKEESYFPSVASFSVAPHFALCPIA